MNEKIFRIKVLKYLAMERDLSKVNIKSNCKQKTIKSYQCQKCEKIFKSKCGLSHHSYEHNDNNKHFTCTIADCGLEFKNPKRLSEHKRRKHFSCNFLCEICGYCTRFYHNLRTHARTHKPHEKPFCCDRCGDCFVSMSQLNEHSRKHIDSQKDLSFNPYRCNECCVDFSSSKAFYHHRKLHLPYKSFVCKFCGATFAQSSGLSQHYRMHRAQNEIGFASKITIEVYE